MTAAGTDPEETGVELDPNREAQIRQLHEELGPVRTLAAVGARAAIGDLLAEIGRLRRVVETAESRTREQVAREIEAGGHTTGDLPAGQLGAWIDSRNRAAHIARNGPEEQR